MTEMMCVVQEQSQQLILPITKIYPSPRNRMNELKNERIREKLIHFKKSLKIQFSANFSNNLQYFEGCAMNILKASSLEQLQ